MVAGMKGTEGRLEPVRIRRGGSLSKAFSPNTE